MKLIKVQPNHYVVVDNSAIKQGDWMYNPDTEPSVLKCIGKGSIRGWEKIIYSTQPLDGVELISLSEVRELIDKVDVEKLAEEYIENYCNHNDLEYSVLSDAVKTILGISFIEGYNQCLQDNKDKKYTENDLKKSFKKGEERGYEEKSCRERYNPLTGYEPKNNKMVFEEIIQHIQSKTEWNVEFVDGKLKLI